MVSVFSFLGAFAKSRSQETAAMTVFRSILLTLSIASLSWATFIKVRHSIHLSVNEPDDPEFKLDNMEKIANEMIGAARSGRPSRLAYKNPYIKTPKCDAHAEFRTYDGTCNNLAQPWMGAAKTPLIRMSPMKYQDSINAPRLMYHYSDSILPSPRIVSTSVHETTSNTSTAHTHLLMNFGQFIDHDITLSPESGGEGGEEANKTQCCEASPDAFKDNLRECFPISTAHDSAYRRNCIPFLRSAPIPGLPGQPVHRYQMNDLTSYLDASMVYGSTKLRADALRSKQGGRLKSRYARNEERLPDEENNPRDCFRGEEECRYASGDVRNSEQAALTSVHTLLLRQHNKMADRLAEMNPHWDDERIYQTARKIMGAMIQVITYNEFLPVVIGPKYMQRYGLYLRKSGRYSGYSQQEDSSVMMEFSTAAFRFGHSLIRQTFTHSGHSIDLKDIFDAYKTTERYGANGMLKGIIHDKIEACDQFVTRGVRNELFGEEMDLISFNVQRGRDHGLGSYYDVKRSLGLDTDGVWDNMIGKSHNMHAVNTMKRVYPHPEDIELFPGGMSETPTEGGVVGDTFAHIIGMQFKKLKTGDRFWHETADKKIGFTDYQLAEIRKVTFAMLFCENVPGVVVRKQLLHIESYQNPRVDCSHIPRLDLSAWQDAHAPHSQPVGHAPRVSAPRVHAPRPRQHSSSSHGRRYPPPGYRPTYRPRAQPHHPAPQPHPHRQRNTYQSSNNVFNLLQRNFEVSNPNIPHVEFPQNFFYGRY